MSIDWVLIWRNSSHNEDRDGAAVQRAFGDTPQQQMADTGYAFRADHHKVGAPLGDGGEQITKRRTRCDCPVHFPAGTSERARRSIKGLVRTRQTLLVDACHFCRDGRASVGQHQGLRRHVHRIDRGEQGHTTTSRRTETRDEFHGTLGMRRIVETHHNVPNAPERALDDENRAGCTANHAPRHTPREQPADSPVAAPAHDDDVSSASRRFPDNRIHRRRVHDAIMTPKSRIIFPSFSQSMPR